MLIADVYKIPIAVSLAVVALFLGIAVVASLWRLRSVSQGNAQVGQIAGEAAAPMTMYESDVVATTGHQELAVPGKVGLR